MYAKIAVPRADGADPFAPAAALCQAALDRAGLSRVTATETGAKLLYTCSVEDWRFEDRNVAA